jgi:hypothetical protein
LNQREYIFFVQEIRYIRAHRKKRRLTMFMTEVIFQSVKIRVTEDLFGPRLKSVFRPARKGESKARGGISNTARKAPTDIQ